MLTIVILIVTVQSVVMQSVTTQSVIMLSVMAPPPFTALVNKWRLSQYENSWHKKKGIFRRSLRAGANVIKLFAAVSYTFS